LSLPYFGGLMRMYSTSQLMRTLSTLLAGGLPLVNVLDVAAASIGNRAMAQAVAGATGRIREGASLTAALAGSVVDVRDQSRITHEVQELVQQRVFTIACGYAD